MFDIFPCDSIMFPPDPDGRRICAVGTTFGSQKYDAEIPPSDSPVEYVEVTIDVRGGVPVFGIITVIEEIIKTYSRNSSSLPHQSSHYTPRPQPALDEVDEPQPPAPIPAPPVHQVETTNAAPRRGSTGPPKRAKPASKPQQPSGQAGRGPRGSYTPAAGEAQIIDDPFEPQADSVIKLPKPRPRAQGQVRGLKLKPKS